MKGNYRTGNVQPTHRAGRGGGEMKGNYRIRTQCECIVYRWRWGRNEG